LVLLLLVSLFPLGFLIVASFTDYTQGIGYGTFGGFSNWSRVFADDVYWRSWLRTGYYVGGGLTLQVLIGTAIALLIYELPQGKGDKLVLTLWMLPIFVAPVVAGLLGRFLLNTTYGLYSWILSSLFGFEQYALGTTASAMPALILIDTWEWAPLITIVVLAGLQSLNENYLEAAEVEGASYFQRLRYVILPLVSRPLMVAILVRSMDILRFVDKIYISTKGGPANSTKITGYYLMENAFRFQDIGAASAIGLTLLILTIILGQLFVKILSRGETL
jgi:multiple sugar transport system permease protein